MMIEFNESFPVHTETLTNTEQLNIVLEKDIRKAGDGLSGRNPSTQCLMTTWDMHKHYQSFELLGDAAIRLAKLLPLATRTHEDGTDYPIDYKVSTSWGLIYSKGQHTGSHTHWPDIWSWTYCVKASKDCSPLVFTHADYSIKPFLLSHFYIYALTPASAEVI